MYYLFCAILCIVCVYIFTVLLPPGGYPIAVKYTVSKHIFDVEHIEQLHVSAFNKAIIKLYKIL
jgi:hypothetical protein